MPLKKIVVAGLIASSLALAAGCSEKLTYDRWSTLTLQSDKTEVETVLGDPNVLKEDNRWHYANHDKNINVICDFEGGDTLTYSQWSDPEHGVHRIGHSAVEGTDVMERDTRKTDIDK